MDIHLTTGKTLGLIFKTNILKLGFVKNIFFTYSFKTVKMYSLLFTGIYYNSYVTSFLHTVRSSLPNSINARIEAARSFMKLDPKSRLAVFTSANMFDSTNNPTEIYQDGED